MFKKLLAVVWVVMIGFSLSCKGPEGEVGPKGDKGDTGATGAAGATGATGAAGKDGDGGGGALIFSSGADTTDADGYFVRTLGNLSAEEIEVWNSSVVLVYLKSGGAYWPLPGLVGFTGGNSEFTFVHGVDGTTFFAEIFQINWTGRASATDKPPVRIVQDLRLIVIPGTILARRDASVTVNWNNYDEAVKALGLVESDVRLMNTKFSKIRRK